ncbi:MAG: hypothetical protein HZA54_04785 [Planctomycetes bacterium]|nr:hypothetical protein [Planctomycetota bacterium]
MDDNPAEGFSALPREAPRPRQHHYVFAHQALPQAVFGPDATRVRAALSGDAPEEIVRFVWNLVAKRLHPENRLPADDLAAEVVERSGRDALVLVHLPTPVSPPEAWFCAVVYRGDAAHYVTLEQSVLTATMLCGWGKDGTHENYGSGCAPTPEAFVAAVKRRVGGQANA